MLNAVGAFLRRHADRGGVILFFLVIAIFSELSVYAVLQPVGLDAVWTLQTTLSVDVFEAQLADLFARDVAEHYLAHYYYDFLNPFWYSALLALLLARGMNRLGAPASWNALVLVPLAAGLLDQVQNLLHLYMVIDTANVSPLRVLLANGAGVLKLAILALTGLAISAVWVASAARRA